MSEVRRAPRAIVGADQVEGLEGVDVGVVGGGDEIQERGDVFLDEPETVV